MATATHGLVTHQGMAAAGISPAEIRSRRRSGLLYEVHRGVYRVGHRAPTVEASYLAAVLACGQGAVLSGLAAAYLLALTKGSPPRAEVTCGKRRQVNGVVTRRSVHRPVRAIVCRGVPVTSVPRTLVDIAAVLNREPLARRAMRPASSTGRRPATWRPSLPSGRTQRARPHFGRSFAATFTRPSAGSNGDSSFC
jgi:hypothetical protein